MTILQKHDEKMLIFNNKDKMIKDYDKEMNVLRKEMDVLNKTQAICNVNNIHNNSDVIRDKISINNIKIKEIENVKRDFISGKTETDYLLDVFSILNNYLMLEIREDELLRIQGDNTEQEIFEINKNKHILSEEYMLIIDPTYLANCKLFTSYSTICTRCKSNLTLEDGFAVCYQCGTCYNTVHEATTLSYKEMQEMDHSPQFTYDKRSHLQDWLRRFQAKDSKEIPQDILDKVVLEAHKERISDLGNLTEDKVKKYLKNLNLNDYYDNVISIINRINKRQPFNLTTEIEDKIMSMFQQIQIPFEKYKDPKRKNMLSYSFILNKFFLILGLPEFSKYFVLLKSPEKLRQQDETFKKIVDHMAKIDKSTSWRFYPSL